MSGTYSPITIQVLPSAAGAPSRRTTDRYRSCGSPKRQSLGVVHLPGPCGGIGLDSPPDVASHVRAFILLKTSALTLVTTARLPRDMGAG